MNSALTVWLSEPIFDSIIEKIEVSYLNKGGAVLITLRKNLYFHIQNLSSVSEVSHKINIVGGSFTYYLQFCYVYFVKRSNL